jgi:hypothetical protein
MFRLKAAACATSPEVRPVRSFAYEIEFGCGEALDRKTSWADYSDDPVIKTTQLSFDTALEWTVFPNLQLDVGANFGLNAVTPAIQVYAGVSQRF